MDDPIEINPTVRHGQPVIRGTRVPVARLVGAVAGGDPIDQVAGDYGVRVEDVRIAKSYRKPVVADGAE